MSSMGFWFSGVPEFSSHLWPLLCVLCSNLLMLLASEPTSWSPSLLYRHHCLPPWWAHLGSCLYWHLDILIKPQRIALAKTFIDPHIISKCPLDISDWVRNKRLQPHMSTAILLVSPASPVHSRQRCLAGPNWNRASEPICVLPCKAQF